MNTKTNKILLYIVIAIVVYGIIYYLVTKKKKGTSTGTNSYRWGGTAGTGVGTGTHHGGGGGHPHNVSPNFVLTTPYYYNQCPVLTGNLNVSTVNMNGVYGYVSNLYVKNSLDVFRGLGLGYIPTCIVFDNVTYYYNGYDGNGVYYQANYNYILPNYVTFFNNYHRGTHRR